MFMATRACLQSKLLRIGSRSLHILATSINTFYYLFYFDLPFYIALYIALRVL